ncbi:MAG: hypothetical protein ACP5E3_01690 [Bacteroidales bacterium]
MKKIVLSLFFASFLISGVFGQNDKFYTENGGEFIFSFADVERNGQNINTPVRFTMFFHLTNKFHYDFSSFAGVYTGASLRNIGFITDVDGIKTKRRTYSAGIPLALKLGALEKDFYVFGGGSYELFFHYKQKQFVDGNKTKFSEWFSPRTERFAPALFAGVHFPGGLTLKFQYYPQNFLNTDFQGTDFGETVDYSEYDNTNLFYIGLSYFIRPKKIMKNFGAESKQTRLVLLEN